VQTEGKGGGRFFPSSGMRRGWGRSVCFRIVWACYGAGRCTAKLTDCTAVQHSLR